jgi:hypothetical protein
VSTPNGVPADRRSGPPSRPASIAARASSARRGGRTSWFPTYDYTRCGASAPPTIKAPPPNSRLAGTISFHIWFMDWCQPHQPRRAVKVGGAEPRQQRGFALCFACQGQTKGVSMDHVEALRRNADECRATARLTKDRESRATWMGLADRWEHCAEVAENKMAGAAENYQRARKMKQSSRAIERD